MDSIRFYNYAEEVIHKDELLLLSERFINELYVDLFGSFFDENISFFQCSIRVDALWNSTLYETAFFDPCKSKFFLFFNFLNTLKNLQILSSVNQARTTCYRFQLLFKTIEHKPILHRIKTVFTRLVFFLLLFRLNSLQPKNRNGSIIDDFSLSIVSREFRITVQHFSLVFLLDKLRLSVLRNIHYAKSIKILNTLTDDTKYIRPPVIYIEYDEFSLTSIGKGTTVDVRKVKTKMIKSYVLFEQITFKTEYRMNLTSHIQAIWIAIGVLTGLGLILAFIQTAIWQKRSGKTLIDLSVNNSLKFLLLSLIVL